MRTSWTNRTAACLAGLLLVGPVGAIALLSLSASRSLEFYRRPTEASLQWWRAAFGFDWASALSVSALTGAMTAGLTLLVCLPAACAWRLVGAPGGRYLLTASAGLLLIPPVGLAVAVSRMLARVGLFDTIPGLALSHVPVVLPVTAVVLLGRFGRSGVAEFASARLLGASPFGAAMTWLSARHRRSIVTALTAGTICSAAEAVITLFVTDVRVTTLTRKALAGANFSVDPTVFAIMTLWMAVAFLTAVLVHRGNDDD